SILQNDIVYHLTVQSDAGCVATDSVKITVFAKAAIYVPSAFTPNNDGLNDLLLPKYAGMKELKFFKVFNRWGQQVFYTTDMSKGWDGMLNGKPQPTGSYVWVVNAVDVDGKLHMLKGTIIIIR
ncbi:MAG: PKD domain-containing protein, partial [Chitinophagaceae bacterium]